MFEVFSKRSAKPPRVYLGALTIVPPRGLNRFLGEDYSSSLELFLDEMLGLPSVSSRTDPRPEDVALDVTLVEAISGDSDIAQIGIAVLPWILRPEVTLTGRLYRIDTGETVHAGTEKRSLSWYRSVKRAARPSAFFWCNETFSVDDVKALAGHAMVDLLRDCRKHI